MKFSGSEVGGLLTMFVAAGMIVCALFSNSWSIHYPGNVLEKVYLTRGILEQCIVTRKESDCQFRFNSFVGSLKFAFVDTYEVYTDPSIKYRHLDTAKFEVVTVVLIVMALFLCVAIIFLSPLIFKGSPLVSGMMTFVAAACCLLGCLCYFYANYTGNAFTMQSAQIMGHSYTALICEKNYLSWAFFMTFASGVLLLTSSFCLCVAEKEEQIPKQEEELFVSQV